MRDIITGKKLDRIIARKADREGVEAYYSAHDFKPLWVERRQPPMRAPRPPPTISRKVDTVGLNPSDYPLPDFKSAVDRR